MFIAIFTDIMLTLVTQMKRRKRMYDEQKKENCYDWSSLVFRV